MPPAAPVVPEDPATLDRRRGRPLVDRRRFLGLSGAWLLQGCSSRTGEVAVLTDWDEQDLASQVQRVPEAARFRMVSADAPTRSGVVFEHVDVVLGGSLHDHEALAARGWLVEGTTRTVARPPIGLIFERAKTAAIERILDEPISGLLSKLAADRLLLADPRSDAPTWAWMESTLKSRPWRRAWGELAHAVSAARRISPRFGLARLELRLGPGSVLIGAADQAPEGSGLGFVDLPGIDRLEAASLTIRGSRSASAQRWLAGLRPAGSTLSSRSATAWTEAVRSLVLDLITSSLVDAHPELRAARIALDMRGWPRPLRASLQAVPAWPPAAIATMSARLEQRNESPRVWLDTLATQLTSDGESRAWLTESWRRPTGLIDPTFLEDLAGAAGGRLAECSRFRSWLRAEWSASARQRYRRVARRALA